MAESKEERIERLLTEGLDQYGLDEISGAILSWEKVLELDPQNVQALDYIKTADRRTKPRSPKREKMASAVAALLQEARLLMRDREYSAALDLLRSASGPNITSLDFEATIELIRSRLFLVHCERVGDLDATPAVKSDSVSLTKFNLPPDAGFLLSMVDGMTSVADLVSVSGMDAFEALHTLCGLIDAGIVEMKA